jgi:hypothetical protein
MANSEVKIYFYRESLLYLKNVPIQFKRLQFLIRLAFAMIINKSQGQTIFVCGLNLSISCFSHGHVAYNNVAITKNIVHYVTLRD